MRRKGIKTEIEDRRAVVYGSIRLRMPDGSVRREKLPNVTHLKMGARYIHPVVFGKRILPLYFTRVRGGWYPDNLKP